VSAVTVTTRPPLRAVAIPNEHGGWGLTAEPIVLGLLIAPSTAGIALGVAAMLAFVARAPLRVVLVDRFRERTLERTRLAGRVLAVEVLLIAAAVGLALATADDRRFWWPAVVAAPLIVIELAYDMRSRSRRLVPEVCGAIGICAVAAMIVIADGSSTAIAVGAWLVLAARAITTIPHVRVQVARLHHRSGDRRILPVADVVAIAAVVVAVSLDVRLLAGAAAVAVLVAVQWALDRRPPPPAKVIGVTQTVFGSAVVIATALGVHLI
jgi:hypothetical protein